MIINVNSLLIILIYYLLSTVYLRTFMNCPNTYNIVSKFTKIHYEEITIKKSTNLKKNIQKI